MKDRCAICNKPARYVSAKFISPLCEECAKKQAIELGKERGIKEEFIELEDYYTEPCEEMENIAKFCGMKL